MGIKSTEVIYDSNKALFGQSIKKGNNLVEALCTINALFEKLFKNDAIECIDLEADLGITCPDPADSKICTILKYLIQQEDSLSKSVTSVLGNVQTVKTNIGTFTDELVKVNKDGKAGYLADLIKGPEHTIDTTNGILTISGLVPIGTRILISPQRVSDFDATGKGKPNTDVWGWAIRNGKNGLDNALGAFVKYTDDISKTGAKDGTDGFSVTMDNIGTFSLPISGTISDALENQVQLELPLGTRNKKFGLGASRDVVVPDPGTDIKPLTTPKDFKHSHAYNLSAGHANDAPTPIAFNPTHIKELPIERINP